MIEYVILRDAGSRRPSVRMIAYDNILSPTSRSTVGPCFKDYAVQSEALHCLSRELNHPASSTEIPGSTLAGCYRRLSRKFSRVLHGV